MIIFLFSFYYCRQTNRMGLDQSGCKRSHIHRVIQRDMWAAAIKHEQNVFNILKSSCSNFPFLIIHLMSTTWASHITTSEIFVERKTLNCWLCFWTGSDGRNIVKFTKFIHVYKIPPKQTSKFHSHEMPQRARPSKNQNPCHIYPYACALFPWNVSAMWCRKWLKTASSLKPSHTTQHTFSGTNRQFRCVFSLISHRTNSPKQASQLIKSHKPDRQHKKPTRQFAMLTGICNFSEIRSEKWNRNRLAMITGRLSRKASTQWAKDDSIRCGAKLNRCQKAKKRWEDFQQHSTKSPASKLRETY